MKNQETQSSAEILRKIPSVDAVLKTEAARKLLNETGAKRLTEMARGAIDSLRKDLLENFLSGSSEREDLLKTCENRLENLWRKEKAGRLQKVINATGVIIHTNLGRAPLSEKAQRAVAEEASRYCTLEYDLETGKRGKRGKRAEALLAKLAGAEAGLIVNNCAAAALFVLTALAKGGEVIISRGELVEIGGDFRVPDVLEQSGAILKEIGTTNRTKISDYAKAVSENTRMILRVHPSNYRIVGFTAAPELAELAQLAREKNILLCEDAGSGALLDLSAYGLADEPVIPNSVKAGADIVMFSGDKLLGGVQSGLIVGRREIIEKLRRHPLYRALRVGKLIYAALEATLEAFDHETALEEIPVLKMLSTSPEELKTRAENFAQRLRTDLKEISELRIETIEGNSVIGGGSAPMVQPKAMLLALTHEKLSAVQMEAALRFSVPPVITRILEDKVLINLRTVSETEESKLLNILTEFFLNCK